MNPKLTAEHLERVAMVYTERAQTHSPVDAQPSAAPSGGPAAAVCAPGSGAPVGLPAGDRDRRRSRTFGLGLGRAQRIRPTAERSLYGGGGSNLLPGSLAPGAQWPRVASLDRILRHHGNADCGPGGHLRSRSQRRPSAAGGE